MYRVFRCLYLDSKSQTESAESWAVFQGPESEWTPTVSSPSSVASTNLSEQSFIPVKHPLRISVIKRGQKGQRDGEGVTFDPFFGQRRVERLSENNRVNIALWGQEQEVSVDVEAQRNATLCRAAAVKPHANFNLSLLS